ncbi:MAG: hypothetical protein WCP96_10820 [Methylococcaceae bacterium]
MNIHRLLKTLFYPSQLTAEAGGAIIRKALQDTKPLMVARFGSVEIKGVLYQRLPKIIRPFVKEKVFAPMSNNAGFFPVSDKAIQEFSNLMIEDMKQLDVLGSWRIEEKFLLKYFPNAKRVGLRALESYLSENPWTEMLEGLKVLVIHPFNTTIERQYHEKRELLFEDKRILPRFKSLETVEAVQTIAGNKGEFDNWFEALDSMKSAIDSKDYDVAIIGCGAYGFPLAAHVKRNGKKAIHLGGATQILFGIKGRRWDDHPLISPLYNEYWVRPAPEDVPSDANKVENGCYW